MTTSRNRYHSLRPGASKIATGRHAVDSHHFKPIDMVGLLTSALYYDVILSGDFQVIIHRTLLHHERVRAPRRAELTNTFWSPVVCRFSQFQRSTAVTQGTAPHAIALPHAGGIRHRNGPPEGAFVAHRAASSMPGLPRSRGGLALKILMLLKVKVTTSRERAILPARAILNHITSGPRQPSLRAAIS